ncbi:MAG: OmpA family protein [Chromatiales bacterium]|nr:OmpA family protein [Chromatiales bacterium]
MKRIAIVLAAGSIALAGCATTSETDDGGNDKAITGAIIGGIVGGVVANNTGGKQSTGRTAVGVLAGAAAGGAIGNAMDKKEAELKKIAAERNEKEMEVERVREDLLKVSVSSEASFDVNSAVLKPEFKPTLNKVANVLYSDPNQRIQVIGHTDSQGTDSYNQGLSERRAKATADYLVAQGVARNQISVEGRGESEPRADNKTAAGRAQNRRVEIYLQQL